MNRWKTSSMILAMGAGLAAAGAPAQATGQARAAAAPRALELFAGGSRIGAAVRNVEETEGARTPGEARGVIVEEVTAEGAAAKAGIRKGDVIVAFDGEPVRSARQLTRVVQETPAGRTVEAVLLRDGQRTTVSVIPEEGGRFSFDELEDLGEWSRELRSRIPPRPAAPPAPARPARPAIPDPPNVREFGGPGSAGTLGITVSPLSDQLAEYFGTKGGVLVSAVNDDSAAARAGLRAGDVITAVNGDPVTAPADVRRRAQRLADGEAFTLSVVRERKTLTLQGKVVRSERRRVRTTV